MSASALPGSSSLGKRKERDEESSPPVVVKVDLPTSGKEDEKFQDNEEYYEFLRKKFKVKDVRVVLYNCAPSPHPAAVSVIRDVVENELIVDNILRQGEGKIDDLCRYRRVSKKWMTAATKELQRVNWERRNFVQLSKYNDFIKYCETVTSSTLHNNLHSCFDVAPYHRSYSEKILKNLFETLENQIRSINLAFEFKSLRQLESLLKTQSSSLEEIKVYTTATEFGRETVELGAGDFQLGKLNFLCLSIYEDDDDYLYNRTASQQRYNVLRTLLKFIPPGKTVKICLLDWKRPQSILPILQTYDQVRNLKVLELSKTSTIALRRGELQALALAGVKLQFLAIEPRPEFGTWEVSDELQLTREVGSFLESQSENLESLSWGSNWQFNFTAQMPKLKKLRLNCEKNFDDEDESEDYNAEENPGVVGGWDDRPSRKQWGRTCVPIVYNNLFPHLDTLELISMEKGRIDPLQVTEFVDWFLPTQSPCPSVKALMVNYALMDIDVLMKVSNIFYNLTDLRLLYSRRVIGLEEESQFHSVIFNAEFSKCLETLFIGHDSNRNINENLGFHQMDAMFSGIEEEQIREIIQSQQYLIGQFELKEGMGRGSILSLKNLNKLVVCGPTLKGNTGGFTDFSVKTLFVKLTKLQFLHIDESVRNISCLGLKMLRSKFIPPVRHTPSEDLIESVLEASFESAGSHSNFEWSLYNLMSGDPSPRIQDEENGENETSTDGSGSSF